MERNNSLFAERLTALRDAEDISARDMSLSLGQSAAYINRIENGKMLPSLSAFFNICDFFSITPHDFFNYEKPHSQELVRAMHQLETLPQEQRKHIWAIISDLSKAEERKL